MGVSVVLSPGALEDNRLCAVHDLSQSLSPSSVELRPPELNCGRPIYPVLMKFSVFVVGRGFSIAYQSLQTSLGLNLI